MHSESISELAKALNKAQATMESAAKDSENPFFKSSYADLSSVWEAARKPLTDNGLSVTQLPGECDGSKIKIQTILMHNSGEWLSSEIEMPYLKNDPQAIGSAITYARRYALAAIVGIVADEDDDGNKAAANGESKQVPPKKEPAKATPATEEARKTLDEQLSSYCMDTTSEIDRNLYNTVLKEISKATRGGKELFITDIFAQKSQGYTISDKWVQKCLDNLNAKMGKGEEKQHEDNE